MNCCNKTYQLGCFNHCSTISFSEAQATATLTGIFTFVGISQAISIATVLGDPYEIRLTALNENAVYSLRLFNADGSLHTITISDVVYDCFEFKTMVIYGAVASDSSGGTGICCSPVTITVTGETRVLLKSEWIAFGAIPQLIVSLTVDGVATGIPFTPIYDQLPNPETITINIPGASLFYITIS